MFPSAPQVYRSRRTRSTITASLARLDVTPQQDDFEPTPLLGDAESTSPEVDLDSPVLENGTTPKGDGQNNDDESTPENGFDYDSDTLFVLPSPQDGHDTEENLPNEPYDFPNEDEDFFGSAEYPDAIEEDWALTSAEDDDDHAELTKKFLDLLQSPMDAENRDANATVSKQSADIHGPSNQMSTSNRLRAIAAVDNRKRAKEQLEERAHFEDDVREFFYSQRRTGSWNLDLIFSTLGVSELHPIIALPYLASEWLQYNELTGQFTFDEHLDDLEKRGMYRKVYLEGFGEFPIPSDLYHHIKFKIYPAWIKVQRSSTAQVDSRCGLNQVPRSGSENTFLGARVSDLLMRLQSALGYSRRLCEDDDEEKQPARLTSQEKLSGEFHRVVNSQNLRADDGEFAVDEKLTKSGLISVGKFKHKWLDHIEDRKSNFDIVTNVNTNKRATDLFVKSHDFLIPGEVRTRGDLWSAVGAMQSILFEAADMYHYARTAHEFQDISDEMRAIEVASRLKNATKEADEDLGEDDATLLNREIDDADGKNFSSESRLLSELDHWD